MKRIRFQIFMVEMVLLLFWLMLAGCAKSQHRVLILEESGTPLVRNIGGPRQSTPPFKLEKEVTFGDPARGAEARLLDPGGVVEVPGGVAILDTGANCLKVFNEDGSLRFSLGRTGQGPGEFNAPRLEHGLTHDGKILITDQWNTRLTRVDPVSGDFETLPQSVTWSTAQIARNRFVVIHVRLTEELEQVEALDLLDADFEHVATLTSVIPGRVLRVASGEDPERIVGLSRPLWPPFGWWVHGGQVIACQGDSYRVEVFNYTGQRERIIEWDAPLRGVTDAEWDSVQQWVQRTYPNDWPNLWHALERPEVMPAIEGVRLDSHGRIWALRYTPPSWFGGSRPDELWWDVIDPDGEWIGVQPAPWANRFFGTDTCYIPLEMEEESVVIRYRMIPNY